MNRKNVTLFGSASLPDAEIYEKEYDYWPWGVLLRTVVDWVTEHASRQAVVLDYMCGTGYLLAEISRSRPDLDFYGCSITPEYVAFANRHYPKIRITKENALYYKPREEPDIVLCTAGLHHLRFPQQPVFVEKVASELRQGSYFLIGEELIREHVDEKSRATAALEMGSALINFSLKSEAPNSITEAAFQVLHNDIFLNGEYKRSCSQIINMLEPHFEIESVVQTWPEDTDAYGDFLFVCRRR